MRSGDVVVVDFGEPVGSEAALRRPAVILMADAFLAYRPTTLFVVPLTTTRRSFPSHVAVEPDAHNNVAEPSWAQVEQMRAVSVDRCSAPSGNVGPVVRAQLLDVLAMIVGQP